MSPFIVDRTVQHTYREEIRAVSGHAITIKASNNFSELTTREIELIAYDRQRALLFQRYGTYNPASVRDYWFPEVRR